MNPANRIGDNLRQHFGAEIDRVDRAASRCQERQKQLLRADGSRIFSDLEHDARASDAVAEFDAAAESVGETAALAIAAAEQDLATLDGSDPIDSLKHDELARAASLATFVDRDAETMIPADVARRVRSLLAANDRPQLAVWLRSLTRILEARRGGAASDPAALELFTLRRDLEAVFSDTKAADKRRALEQRISSAKVLTGQVARRRRELDGSEAQALAEMRRQYATF